MEKLTKKQLEIVDLDKLTWEELTDYAKLKGVDSKHKKRFVIIEEINAL